MPRRLRAGTGVTRPQPGVGRRAGPRPQPRISAGATPPRHPRIIAGATPLGHPRISAGATPLGHPGIRTRVTRLRPGIGGRTGPRPRPRIGIGATPLGHPRVGSGITRLQPGIGRRTWPRAGEGAGSRVGGGPPAVTGVTAGIIGGRAPPGSSGFLRTSVSHASPLRPAERNPSWPSSAKSLHHAASAGGAATWSAVAGLSVLVGAWSRPNRSRARLSLCAAERHQVGAPPGT